MTTEEKAEFAAMAMWITFATLSEQFTDEQILKLFRQKNIKRILMLIKSEEFKA